MEVQRIYKKEGKTLTLVRADKTCYKRRTYYVSQHSWFQRIGGANAICNPVCANGGTCVAPNQCSCPSIVGGDNCQEPTTCLHLQPCFPGICNVSSCLCEEGFGGNSCLQLESPQTATKVIDFEAIFDPYVPYPPLCINGSSLGIVSAHSRVILSKIGREEGTKDISLNETFTFPGSYNESSPFTDVLKCNISYD
uniref:EGF-like domain-containing protein n=1 Tax=Magallana gigas TaxID=29159 RepID=A0A8W8KZY2_MAGGI